MQRYPAVLRLFIVIICVFLLVQPLVAAPVYIDFIDVGQGDSILIRVDDQWALLIDGGTQKSGREVVVPFLRELGLEKLDLVLITHPHADHIGGLIPVLEQIPVACIYSDAQVHTSATYLKLLGLIEELQIDFYPAREGVEIPAPGIDKLAVLHPAEPLLTSLNNNSTVIYMEANDFKFLFTGDIEREAEARLGQKDLLQQVDVLKVAHHGSKTSSTLEFLLAVNPAIAVIMVGQNNSYGHPDPEVLIRLSELNVDVYRTDNEGTISMTATAGQLTVKHSKP